MTQEKKNNLAAELIEFNLKVVKEDEYLFTKDNNFEELKKNYEVQQAITTILEYLEKQG